MSRSRSPIDTYLHRLSLRLWFTTPLRRREILREAEDHLRETSASLVSQGLDTPGAENEAVRRFGAFPRSRTARRSASVAVGLLALAIGLIAVAHTGPAGVARAAAPFDGPGGTETGPESGLWGDTGSGPSGDHIGCMPGRRFTQVVTLRNRSPYSVTITGATGPVPDPRVMRRVGVQLRLAPQSSDESLGDALEPENLRPWSTSPAGPVAIPPGRSAVVQSDFLMSRCTELRPHRTLTYNRSIVVTYRLQGRAGRQKVAQGGARIVLSRGPTIQTCTPPQGATQLVSYDIPCRTAEQAAVTCHFAHRTSGTCHAAAQEWGCTYQYPWTTHERCWLATKRQSISVRWSRGAPA